ncbi:MAG: hypothetical protein QNJ41_14470 [Xenococcaceae cyanobacterium MO_188.B32]|nr:hypothetical protein [Xenococcaceae cyanobacterium MO_188.B32]
MSQWQEIGYNLEAKLVNKNSIWVRNQGQQEEYPHLIVSLDDQNNIIGVRPSDSQAAMGSIEGTLMILDRVKDKLLDH